MTLAFAYGQNSSPPPSFRSFFRIGNLDYEYSDHEVIIAVTELLSHGVPELTIRRVIIDSNQEPSEKEPVVLEESEG